MSRAFETALRAQSVPYQMVNGLEFFQRKEIKDVLAYLQVLNNPRDRTALLRILNVPPRGIGKTLVGRLVALADQRGLSLLEACRECQEKKGTAPICRNGPEGASHKWGLSPFSGELPQRSLAAVRQFVDLLDRLSAAAIGPVEELMGLVLSETGYQRKLKLSEDAEDQERLANIEELLTVAREYDERNGEEASLEGFLEEACLTSDTDAWESDADRVTLMTLHASKGLEFPVVFLTAVEEGLLPHERSRDTPAQLEEERRLMFVGITRAQEELELSMAQYRDFRGQRKMTIPSQFLMELPRAEMEVHEAEPAVPAWSQPAWEPRRGRQCRSGCHWRLVRQCPVDTLRRASPGALRLPQPRRGLPQPH